MPKEKVYSRQFLPESDEHPAPRLAVEVSWSKESEHVQIATIDGSAAEVPGGRADQVSQVEEGVNHAFEQRHRYADRLVGEDGTAALDPDLLGEMVPGVHRGWFVTVNRTEINQLIRLLRRARDGAYGQDA